MGDVKIDRVTERLAELRQPCFAFRGHDPKSKRKLFPFKTEVQKLGVLDLRVC